MDEWINLLIQGICLRSSKVTTELTVIEDVLLLENESKVSRINYHKHIITSERKENVTLGTGHVSL